MSAKRVHLIVRGRVTGVFFRAATQREARRLGITGWVRNRPDGNVEIVAEAEEDAIKEMVSWAQHGPSAARVEDVDIRWRGYTGEFSDFRIVECRGPRQATVTALPPPLLDLGGLGGGRCRGLLSRRALSLRALALIGDVAIADQLNERNW